jgi:hypothetical protein
MLDLKQLEAEREKASRDKCDLFDFYNNNWDEVVAELTAARDRLHAIELYHELKREPPEATLPEGWFGTTGQ